MNIVELDWPETIPVRHAVLWPNEPSSFCHVEGDDEAWHFGVLVDGRLVCVASIYTDGNSARLRKFVTLEEYQGQGIGSSLLQHILSILEPKDISHIWCDARESTVNFYSRFGLQADGNKFYKSGIPYLTMSRSLP
jgi:predicted GNAT family N-acyltransferase